MGKGNHQLRESFKGLAISFTITIIVGIALAVVFGERSSLRLSFVGIASLACTGVSMISYLIWALVSGITSQQYLRFYHLCGYSRDKAFWKSWVLELIACASAAAVLSLLSLPIALHAFPLVFFAVLFAGLLAESLGQLFGMMALAIPSKPVAGISIALAAFVVLNALAEEAGFVLPIAILAFVLSWFLYTRRHCPIKSTAIS